MSETYLNYFKDAITYQLKELEEQIPISIKDITCPVRNELGQNIDLVYMRLFRLALRDTYGSKLSSSLLYEAGRHTAINNFKFVSIDDIVNTLNDLSIGVMKVVYNNGEHIIFQEEECAICSGMPTTDEALCSFESGFLAGALSCIMNKNVVVEETECWGLGDQICQFEASIISDTPPKSDEKMNTLDLIATLASRSSKAIALNKELKKKNDIFSKQLEFAQRIQKKIIPHMDAFKSDYYNFYSYLKPFREVGGDFYDFFFDKDSNKVAIAIADMAGHGIDAAMITGMIKLTLKHCSKKKGLLCKPSKVMAFIEADISDVVPDNFFSMIYMVFDPDKQSIRYCNAGHPSAILYRKKQNIMQFLHSNQPLVGLSQYIDDYPFVQQSILYEKGDQIFLYTDGVTELRNRYGEFYKTSTLLDIIRNSKDLSISTACENIIASLNEHRQERDFEDDMCLLGIQL
ncbi:serine phosphatase RsbU (regulator of sigma subunit) [Alkalibaculum bacchi]|uniref:Serine phosphatase RsbU (Regulator of sigma subunit) n=1 Tax=Alkalibaculum bacchi TaxID=645887 RepID=A0A366IIE5_9FIRM|nr:SpoIIE family protein phosphatase [Alkalibaculum bacchi]RBP70058.1 serine phosphatase RsbU (regulator of sigma subunit) [Alkalibaculum bacchi]